MVDVKKLKSHPDKFLLTHANGVIENTKILTHSLDNSKLAELAAIFHDLGKINPFFQNKLINNKVEGYTHHAYFSAFAFFSFCVDKHNREYIRHFLGNDNFQNKLISLIILIAKHHGHLPDFCPVSDNETDAYILNKDEIESLYSFLDLELEKLPVDQFIQHYDDFKNINSFKSLLENKKVKDQFLEKIIFNSKSNINHLDFFLDTQFAFSALIQADKIDAMDSKNIEEDKKRVQEFCRIYPATLNKYISKFNADTKLNSLRTQIREESKTNIQKPLQVGKRVFELTAPTGSGKTVMLLSLASKIIESKGNFRIMYALPFLSITEQVEKEVLAIFKEFAEKEYVQRIDSKASNQKFEKVQAELDAEPSKEKIKQLAFLAFQEQVFAYPFVITTFVRFFETLLSNRNSILLKLPNFSKTIFLLDEIQALPPRLYTFFVAYLTKFCEKFNSYAIISTATQPNFDLPKEEEIQKFFNTFQKPTSILEHQKYFENDVFNRYQIDYIEDDINTGQLAEQVLSENTSVLVILNTIDDSKALYNELEQSINKDDLCLLNTHFTPNDRKKKIADIKQRLEENKRIILVSTQLIEAGVDIDFPVLYRDFALISSIIQSAGRCNRNGKLNKLGKVRLFNLAKEGKKRANLIYGRGRDKDILTFTKKAWGNANTYQEKELLNVQKDFFNKIAHELHFARHSQKKFSLDLNFLDDIKECAYAKIGKFQLIDEQEYGEQIRFYVPTDDNDKSFENLIFLHKEMLKQAQQGKKDWDKINLIKRKIDSHLKKMSGQVVQVRLKGDFTVSQLGSPDEYFGLLLLHKDLYSKEKGVILNETSII